MKNFTCVQDIGNLQAALAEAFEIKKDRFKYVELGRNKTLLMIFFNSSLRTRLSTQKAALNLGMNVIVLDINQGAWKLETERGVIMEQNTLNGHVSNLKKAMKAEGSCIETVHNIGYRWNQPVEKGERRMLQEEEKDCCKS